MVVGHEVRRWSTPWQTCRVPTTPLSSGSSVGAAIDLGSNSVHLLVAELEGHDLRALLDESVFLGLGSAIAERGHLGPTGRRDLADALGRYVAAARGLGAATVTVLGTEPIRRAADGAAIVEDLVRASGVPVHVVSHEEEAYLTLIGVTSGRSIDRTCLVVDIGGGSSEFNVVEPGRPPRAIGLQLGSARLTDRYIRHEPPGPDEILALRAAATLAVADAPDAAPAEIVAVGGTASNLRKLSAGGGVGSNLTRADLEAIEDRLATASVEGLVAAHGLRPTRARLLPAGAAIVAAVMDRYGLSEVRISEAGIREGAILAVAHAGRAWRDRLAELARGWRSDAD